MGGTGTICRAYYYDIKGRMTAKTLHGSSTNRMAYSYNVRSWLTGISSGKFTQTLGYGSHYNGSISTMNWTANGASHSYTFAYDALDRMLSATHGSGLFTEKVGSYDKNGNILSLQRYGNGLIDNLTYTYSGNQVTKVEDATGNTAGFSNGASTANEYVYDANGNLTKDSNKNISSITYNSLNLPSKVTFSDGSTISYTYAADGTKLRTVHTIGGVTTQNDYCANVIYENGTQKYLLNEEGYVDLSASTPTYYYYLRDHQGNNRVVINSSGTVQETNHYYPFGGLFSTSTNVQPYKYNGKELDTKKGLNWYDYGARHYDAALGRWMVQDPLAEKYYGWSPYGYCMNNPVKYVDPDGKMKVIYNPDGTYKETTHNNWFHNTFIGRQQYIDYGNRLTQLSEDEFWQWQITGHWGNFQPAKLSTVFEFWLDSPSENIVDNVIKIIVSEGYSKINSPLIVLTGRTLGGAYQTPSERIESFMETIEILPISKSLKLLHPGTSKYFYKANGENYFSRQEYKLKVKRYKNINRNKKAFNWILDYLITPANEIKEEE